jgi:plastocyanin
MEGNQENTENTIEEQVQEPKKGSPLVYGIIAVAALILVGGLMFSMRNTAVSQPQNKTVEDVTVSENDSIAGPDNLALNSGSKEEIVTTDEENGVNIVNVEGGSFYFKPNVITVKKGETVTIVLNSVDMMHDLVIDGLNVRTEIAKSGETAEVEFTASEAGEFEFYCSVGNHRANGMTGTLIVEE